MPETVRALAVGALLQIHQRQGYSQLVLDNVLTRESLSPADRALLSRLVYGVLERELTLDFLLAKCSSIKLSRLHPTVLEILRVGAYQILFLEKVPDAAAVNEAVKIAKTKRQGQASGYINAVLRALSRRKTALWEEVPEGDEGWSIRTSCPLPLLRLWREAYGEQAARSLAECLNDVPPQTLRVNTLKTTLSALAGELSKAGISFEIHPELPDCLSLPSGTEWKKLAFLGEKCYYQDSASQYCVMALCPQPGDRVADVCAAPGGKSFTAAQWMEDRGRILSGDLYPEKCETMERRARSLGITCLQTAVRDAAQPCPEPLRGAFDRVLCDVPCSGLGAIRRKPEIRYKSLDPARELPALQYRILEQAAWMVRPGGILQYSTCTLHPAENEQITARFLREHPEFSPRVLPLIGCFEKLSAAPSHEITLFPHIHGTDGFYIAGFYKRED